MSRASDIAAYFAALTAKCCSDHPVYLGTRGLESLRVNGQPMRLEIPHAGDNTAGDF
jgi:hypothetical protein